MRAFVKLREVMGTHKELAHKIEALERKYDAHDEELQLVFKPSKSCLRRPHSRSAESDFRPRQVIV